MISASSRACVRNGAASAWMSRLKKSSIGSNVAQTDALSSADGVFGNDNRRLPHRRIHPATAARNVQVKARRVGSGNRCQLALSLGNGRVVIVQPTLWAARPRVPPWALATLAVLLALGAVGLWWGHSRPPSSHRRPHPAEHRIPVPHVHR